MANPVNCLDGACVNGACLQQSTCPPSFSCVNAVCVNNTSGITSTTSSTSSTSTSTSSTSSTSTSSTTSGLPGGSTTSTSSTTSSSGGLSPDDITLGLDVATITSLPKVFALINLPININDIRKAANIAPNILEKYTEYFNRRLKKKDFEDSLISGGKAYIGLQLNPSSMLQSADIASLIASVQTKLDNKEVQITSTVSSYDPVNKKLVLETKLPSGLIPGNATLFTSLNSKIISRTNIEVLPSLTVRSIVKKILIGKPILSMVHLNELNSTSKKKLYLLRLSGVSFMKRTVNINNKLIVSPIKYQPFSIITFTDNNGVTIRRMRVTRDGKDKRRTKMEVLLEYEDPNPEQKSDIRFFTISTLAGQVTGSVNLKSAVKSSKNIIVPSEDILLNLDDKTEKNLKAPQIIQGNQPTNTNAQFNQATTGSNTTAFENATTTIVQPQIINATNNNTSNNGNEPAYEIPQAYNNDFGRPPTFGETGTRPPSLSLNNSSSSLNSIKPPSLPKLPKLPKLQAPEGSNTLKLAKRTSPQLPNIPDIELIPAEISSIEADTSQKINAKKLDLGGTDQIIITPTIPLITITTKPVVIINDKKGTKEKKPKEEITIKSSEARGVIKGSTVGYLINTKAKIKLAAKDLKNIIHVVISENNEVTVLPGSTEIQKDKKLLAKLYFPDKLSTGKATFATLLNKGGGKKITIAKSQINISDPVDYKNKWDISSQATGLPKVTDIKGRITRDSVTGKGKIIRLIISGENFASKSITINGQTINADPFKIQTKISFLDEKDIEILRARVSNKGRKILLTIRYTGNDISSVPFTISTPKGQYFNNKINFELANKPQEKNNGPEINKNLQEIDKKDEKKQ